MPARRELTMRQLRQMLRLHHDGVSAREIGRTLGVARSTIQNNLERARNAGIGWPLPAEWSDIVLEQRLLARSGVKPGQRRGSAARTGTGEHPSVLRAYRDTATTFPEADRCGADSRRVDDRRSSVETGRVPYCGSAFSFIGARILSLVAAGTVRMAAARRNATVNTGYVTIITPIVEGHADALKHFLRTEVEPIFDRNDPREILKCRPRFPFDRIGTLHFCSLTVLDGDAEFPPYLVFEATFDGSLDYFLDALLQVAPDTIDEIYRHCDDYPASGRAIPELVKNYLARHDEGAHTFYFRSPGRTVAQIEGEAQVYDAVANSVCRPWSRHKAMPATFAGIQQELQDTTSKEAGLRWAQQTAAVAWEVAWRKALPVAAVLVVLGMACVLGVSGVRLGDLCDPTARFECVNFMVHWLVANPISNQGMDYLIRMNLPKWLSGPLRLLPLIAVWAGLRLIEFWLRSLFKDPRRQNFYLRVFFHILIILRYFFIAVIAGFLVALGRIPNLSPRQTIAMLIGAGFVFLLFQYWLTSLKLAVQFQELERAQEARRLLLVDTLRVGRVVVPAFALLVLIHNEFIQDVLVKHQWLPSTFFSANGALLELDLFALVGLIVAYTIGCLLFVGLRIMEHCEAKRFSNAEGLAAFDNSSAYAREEGGINTYQNHLISLTYVKPGLARALCLRLTLFVVGVLSRFWYNKGELGGIPTILSARWVLIDGGRRLLFLDHYSGAWNNYLNEFIDMTAVFGLNAIWTNTFIKARRSQYGFPETEYYFWKGAQVERPFKAYVRHSQIETLVWYGAYPTVSTVNVNTNTEVRRSLFKPPVSCEIDSLLQNL